MKLVPGFNELSWTRKMYQRDNFDDMACVTRLYQTKIHQLTAKCPCWNVRFIPQTSNVSNFWALTHWGRVTPICVGEIIIIGSDNGLSPDRCQAIIWTNAGLLSIEPLQTYFSENLIKIQPFSLKKMHMKMSSAKWRPSCLGLNALTQCGFVTQMAPSVLVNIGSGNGVLHDGKSHYLNEWGLIVNWPTETNFSNIWIKMHKFAFKNMLMKMLST